MRIATPTPQPPGVRILARGASSLGHARHVLAARPVDSRPLRIQRRMVLTLTPARSAAWATVSWTGDTSVAMSRAYGLSRPAQRHVRDTKRAGARSGHAGLHPCRAAGMLLADREDVRAAEQPAAVRARAPESASGDVHIGAPVVGPTGDQLDREPIAREDPDSVPVGSRHVMTACGGWDLELVWSEHSGAGVWPRGRWSSRRRGRPLLRRRHVCPGAPPHDIPHGLAVDAEPLGARAVAARAGGGKLSDLQGLVGGQPRVPVAPAVVRVGRRRRGRWLGRRRRPSVFAPGTGARRRRPAAAVPRSATCAG